MEERIMVKQEKLYRKYFQILWNWQYDFEEFLEDVKEEGETVAWLNYGPVCGPIAERDGIKYEVITSEKALAEIMLQTCHMLVM